MGIGATAPILVVDDSNRSIQSWLKDAESGDPKQ